MKSVLFYANIPKIDFTQFAQIISKKKKDWTCLVQKLIVTFLHLDFFGSESLASQIEVVWVYYMLNRDS